MKSILDRTFQYTPSHATDVRKTFERVRRELALGIAPRSAPIIGPTAAIALGAVRRAADHRSV